MQLLTLLLVFVDCVLLIVGIYAFANRRRLTAQAVLRERLSDDAPPHLTTVLRDPRRSTVPLLDKLLTERTVSLRIERMLQRAGARLTVGEFVLTSAAMAAVAFLLTQDLGTLIALGSAFVALLLPTLVLKIMHVRRLNRFEEQLPEAIDMIVNAMRAGFSVQWAMRFVGEESPAPLGPEFMRFYDEQRLGVDARRALLNLQDRVDSLDLKMFVTAVIIQRETGGNLGEILSGLAGIIRDRATLRGQIDALTAEPRFTGWALALLPVIAFAAILLLNRPMLDPMFALSSGHLMLAYSVVSLLVGFYFVRRLARIPV